MGQSTDLPVYGTDLWFRDIGPGILSDKALKICRNGHADAARPGLATRAGAGRFYALVSARSFP
jgi:hypothetical protein